MSYTTEDELLAEPLIKAVDALETVRSAIMARLKNRAEWKEEHLKGLGVLLLKLQDIQTHMVLLADQVR